MTPYLGRRPTLELLETRDVPAGALTSSLAGGVLTLTGTDAAEEVHVQAQATARSFKLLGQNGTTIDGQTDATFTGVTTIKFSLRGGDDRVSLDASVNPAFALEGSFRFDGGDGDNSLTLGSLFSPATNTVGIGGNLAVFNGSGDDSVTLQAGGGTTVQGRAWLNFGPGDSTTSGSKVTVNGADGLLATAEEGDDAARFTDLTVVNRARFAFGDGDGTVSVNGTTSIGTNLSVMVGAGDGSFSAGGTLTAGNNVMLNLGEFGSANVTDFSAEALTALARNLSFSSSGSLAIDADANFSGVGSAVVDLSGTTTVGGNLTWQGGAGGFGNRFAVDAFADGPLTVGGDATFAGGASGFNEITIQSGSADQSSVGGRLNLTGGTGDDQVILDNIRVAGRAALLLSSGDNAVSFGQGVGPVDLMRSVNVTAGAGRDSVQFLDATVSRATAIDLGNGADSLTAADSTFTAFTLDTSGGDDSISLQPRFFGSEASTTFQGRVSVSAGAGNDTLTVGTLTDPARSAVFLGPAVFDGDAGLNSFDEEAANFTGDPVFLNFTDPTP